MAAPEHPNSDVAWEPRKLTEPPARNVSYELKFLLPALLADKVLAQARRELPPDPHAEPALGEDCYRVYSLYFDTADLSVYHRRQWYGSCKLRIRRYGEASQLFLERKARKADRVRKRRVQIRDNELAQLAARTAVDASWPGEWFRRRLAAKQLQPCMLVGYQRFARVGMTSEGPARLTVDRQIFCRPAEGLHVPPFSAGRPLLEDRSIVEFKFVGFLPGLFKRLMYDLGLQPAAVSKYRLSVGAWGLQRSVNGDPSKAADDLLLGGYDAACA